MSHRGPGGAGLGLVVAALVVAAALSASQQQTAPTWQGVQVASRGGFATSTTCRSCHQQAHASWVASYHRSMTQRPSPETVRADFDNRTISMAGLDVTLEHDDDGYWMTLPDFEGMARGEVDTQAVSWASPARRATARRRGMSLR